MIVKFFKHGTTKSGNKTAKSVKGYLLDKERVQAQTANIIRGDEQETSRLIDLCNQAKFSSTYTAGCLSFDEKESLTNEQKQALMQSFEQALLPEFDPTRYACYWVEHTDKGRLELNFVFAKIDLATGKHLDIFQQRRDVTRLNNWKEIKIQQYGLIDPNAPARERDFVVREHTIRRADGTSPADNYSQIKQEIDDYLRSNIELGYIVNSEDIKRYIEYIDGDISQATGYQVKQNKTGVSITNTETQDKFRLQGKIYARDFCIQKSERASKNRIESERNERQAIYDREQVERLERASEWYNRLSQQRAEQLNKKYGRKSKGDKPSLSLATVGKRTYQHLDEPQHEISRANRADTDELGHTTKQAPSLTSNNTRADQSSPTRERGADNTDDYAQDTQPIHTRVFTGDLETSGQSIERTDTSPDTKPSTSNRPAVYSFPNRANPRTNGDGNGEYGADNDTVQSSGQHLPLLSTRSKVGYGYTPIFAIRHFRSGSRNSLYSYIGSTKVGLVGNAAFGAGDSSIAICSINNHNIVSLDKTPNISKLEQLTNEQHNPQPTPRPLQLFEKCRSLIERAYRQIRDRRAKREQRLEKQKRERERQAKQRLAERDKQLKEYHTKRADELANGKANRDNRLAGANPKLNQFLAGIGEFKERIEQAIQLIANSKQRTSDTKRELDRAKQALAGAVKRTSDREQQHQQQRENITGSVNIAIQSSNTGLTNSPREPRYPSQLVQDGNGRATTADGGQPSLSQPIPDGSSELQSSESQLRDSPSQSTTLIRTRVREPETGTEIGIVGGIETEIKHSLELQANKPLTLEDEIRQRVYTSISGTPELKEKMVAAVLKEELAIQERKAKEQEQAEQLNPSNYVSTPQSQQQQTQPELEPLPMPRPRMRP